MSEEEKPVEKPSPYVRTLPHYVPWLRAWRPVKVKILVCDSKRQRVDVNVTLQEVPGRFGWPLGHRIVQITCWSDVGSDKDICTGSVTIWPHASGKPSLLITSADGAFPNSTIESRDAPEAVATFQSVDAKSSIDDRTYLLRRLKRLAKRAGVGLGILGTFAVLLWVIHEDKIRVTEEASTPVAITKVETPQAPVEVTAPQADPQPELVAPRAPRRDCLFVDPDRTQDANGKVTVMCGGVLWQATATYLENGCFQFSDLTPRPH